MWDVTIADSLGTTPWDVRENATLWDVARLREWVNAKNAGQKVQAQRDKAKMDANSARSRSARRR